MKRIKGLAKATREAKFEFEYWMMQSRIEKRWYIQSLRNAVKYRRILRKLINANADAKRD